MQNAGGFPAPLGREAPGPGCEAVGSWGSLLGGQCPGKATARVPPAHQPGWAREGWRLHGSGCCPQAGHRPCGPLPFPTLRCAPREDGRARANLISQLCHRSVSQGESESPRTEPSPSGVTALPLPFLPSSRVLGAGASPHMGHSAQPGHAPCQPRCPPQVYSQWQGVRGTQLPIPLGRLSHSLVPEHTAGGRMVPYLQKPAEKHPGLHSVSQGHVWKQGSP